MGLGDIRYDVITIVNEVQRKLGLTQTAALNTNSLSVQLVDFVNDVINDISDFGNWQEMIVSAVITAVSGQRDYSITTSANVKNIGDIFFSTKSGPIRYIPIDQMRILSRVTAVGTPNQFTIFGTDAGGNPNLRFNPIPGANEDGELFSVVYFSQPQKYTTADTSAVVPFPGDVVVAGVYAKAILNETDGSPTPKYQLLQQDYIDMRKEALNRFKGDTGWSTSFRPVIRGRRR